jgi:hypothetical protein
VLACVQLSLGPLQHSAAPRLLAHLSKHHQTRLRNGSICIQPAWLPSCHTPHFTLLCPRHMARIRLDGAARCSIRTASLPTAMPSSDKRVIDPLSHQLVHGSADRSQLLPRLVSHADTVKKVAHTPITHRLASYNLSVVCLQQSQDTDTLAPKPPPTMIGQQRVVGGCIPARPVYLFCSSLALFAARHWI